MDTVATVGPADPYAREFYYFGAGAGLLAPQGVIYNERYLSLGDGTLVGHVSSQLAGKRTELVVGDHVVDQADAQGFVG